MTEWIIGTLLTLSGVSITGLLGHWIRTREEITGIKKDIEMVNQKIDSKQEMLEESISSLEHSLVKLENVLDKLNTNQEMLNRVLTELKTDFKYINKN